MKYNVGDKVRIKSIDWYNENKNKYGEIKVGDGYWNKLMGGYCGSIMTIYRIVDNKWYMMEETFESAMWTDEMIECLVAAKGEGTRSYAFGKVRNSMKEETKPQYEDEIELIGYSSPKQFICPIGYEFKDENGNIINASKIVLEKKKPKYPKSYEECINELDTHKVVAVCAWEKEMKALQTLLICRDAYWKIAGEEMGLGKPWEPDFTDFNEERYGMYTQANKVVLDSYGGGDINTVLTFPTEEMRDAFYEAFKELIEKCKELL